MQQNPQENGCCSHLSTVALWQVRHEDSVFCFFFFLLLTNHGPMHLLLLLPPFPFPLPPSFPPSILHSGCCPFLDGAPCSSCCLTEGRDVGTTTRGHYDTPASWPDGDVIWGGGTWTGIKGEKDERELHEKKKKPIRQQERRERKPF